MGQGYVKILILGYIALFKTIGIILKKPECELVSYFCEIVKSLFIRNMFNFYTGCHFVTKGV